MPQENKNEVLDKPRLFGTENSEYESAKVPEHFKFIISPENQNVNLKVLASEFIRRVETMTGYKLLWQGAVHTDTAHRHAHHVQQCRGRGHRTGHADKSLEPKGTLGRDRLH